jgi:hypothetical protein
VKKATNSRIDYDTNAPVHTDNTTTIPVPKEVISSTIEEEKADELISDPEIPSSEIHVNGPKIVAYLLLGYFWLVGEC